MYVAVTRAKEKLFISYPINVFDKATGMVLSKPSRFLDGLSRKIIEPVFLMEDDDSRDNAWRSNRYENGGGANSHFGSGNRFGNNNRVGSSRPSGGSWQPPRKRTW